VKCLIPSTALSQSTMTTDMCSQWEPLDWTHISSSTLHLICCVAHVHVSCSILHGICCVAHVHV
jgi:hypothetical protein